MAFNVRMRAAQGGSHETGGKHISGAERLVAKEDMLHHISQMLDRAFSHEKGVPDFVNIAVEEIPEEAIQEITVLPIDDAVLHSGPVTEGVLSQTSSQVAALLHTLGVSAMAIQQGFALLQDLHAELRGAILVDAMTGERLDMRGQRGVRVSAMDVAAEGQAQSFLRHKGLDNVHVREALVLATKVQSAPGIVAEWCCSDDPSYTTGYVAGQGTYYRVGPMKHVGDEFGGRVFFVNPAACPDGIEGLIHYLENSPVRVAFAAQTIATETARKPGTDSRIVVKKTGKGTATQDSQEDSGKTTTSATSLYARYRETLADLHVEHRYRQMQTVFPVSATEVCLTDDLTGQRYIQLSSNNYLGLTHHPRVQAAAQEAIERYGTSSTGSRLTSGSHAVFARLEEHLATFKGTERSLVLNTGYMANVGVLSTLVGKEDVVISDEYNHASIIDGIRMSRAQTLIYPHRDMAALEKHLQTAQQMGKQAVVATDSVFSMDGTIAPLAEMDALCRKYGALLILDDAHATGVIGRGHGGAAHAEIEGDHIVHVGTLSKALASEGGFVCASDTIIEYLINKARPYIFSTALSPATIAAADAALSVIEEEPALVDQLSDNWQYVVTALQEQGVPVATETPILPVLAYTNEKALQMQQGLFARGMIGMAIRPPTVPEGTARLRLTISAALNQETLDRIVESVVQVYREV